MRKTNSNEAAIERMCTSKRAFATQVYAKMFAANVIGRDMHVYRCRICYEWHLSTKNNDSRSANTHRDSRYPGD